MTIQGELSAEQMQQPESLQTAESERAHAYFRQLLQEGIQTYRRFAASPPQTQQLLEGTGVLKPDDVLALREGRRTPRLRALALLFFHTLLDMLHANRNEQDRDTIAVFLQTVETGLFRRGEITMSDFLPPADKVTIAAEMTTIPDAQSAIGNHLVGELSRDLAEHDVPEQEIIEEIARQPTPHVLDILHFLPVIVARANQHQADRYQQDAIAVCTAVGRLIEGIRTRLPSMLVHIEAMLARDRIVVEDMRSSLEGMGYRDVHAARLAEALPEHVSEECEHLLRQVRLDPIPDKHKNIIGVALDAVGMLDGSALVGDIALIDRKNLPAPLPVAAADVERLMAAGFHSITGYIGEVHRRLLVPWQGQEKATGIWCDILDMEPVKVQPFLDSLERFENQLRKQQRSEQHCSGEISVRRSLLEVALLEDIDRILLETGQSPFAGQESLWRQYRDAVDRYDNRAAIQALRQLLAVGNVRHDAHERVAAAGVVHGADETMSRLQQRLVRFGEECSAMEQQCMRDFAPTIQEHLAFANDGLCIDAMQSELDDKPDVQQGILDALAPLATAAGRLPQVHFGDCETVLSDPRFTPFGGNSREIALLLRHLHRPAMRTFIELQLGARLQDMTLRSQIHLLRFLQDASPETFERLGEVLKTCGDQSPVILESFLVCAEDLQMGNLILRFAAQEDVRPVFRSYATLIEHAEMLAHELEAIYKPQDEKYSYEYFYRQTLVRANRLLRVLENRLKRGPDARPQCIQQCRNLLLHEDQEIQTLQYLLGTLPREKTREFPFEILPMVDLPKPMRATELQKSPKVLEQALSIIKGQFSKKDYDQFTQCFLHMHDAKLLYVTCSKKLLGMFGLVPMSNGARNFDWYVTNPQAAVPGLAEAMLLAQIRREDVSGGLYAVAAPNVISFETIVEHLGSDAYEETEPGEYDGRYMRLRILPEERHEYLAKMFSSAEIAQVIAKADEQAGGLQDVRTRGETFKVCRIDMHGDGQENAECVYSLMNRLQEEELQKPPEQRRRWVISRFIPGKGNTKERHVHYCVFERDRLTGTTGENVHRHLQDAVTALNARYVADPDDEEPSL